MSGQKLIKMEALRKLLSENDLYNVQTYIQSGNIIFSSKLENIAKIEEFIHQLILDQFGFEVPVMVLTKDSINQIISSIPYDQDENGNAIQITFLSTEPNMESLEKLNEVKRSDEMYLVTKRAMYLLCPSGYGQTKLHNSFIEKNLKTKATTRNLKTTMHLQKMIEDMP